MGNLHVFEFSGWAWHAKKCQARIVELGGQSVEDGRRSPVVRTLLAIYVADLKIDEKE